MEVKDDSERKSPWNFNNSKSNGLSPAELQVRLEIEQLKRNVQTMMQLDDVSELPLNKFRGNRASQSAASVNMALRRELKGHFDKVYAIDWCPAKGRSRLVSASQDGRLTVWNPKTANKLQSITLRSSWVMTCAFSQTGSHVASGGLDNIVSVFKLPEALMPDYDEAKRPPNELEDSKLVAEFSTHEGYISCCRFIDPNTVISTSGDAKTILWDLVRRSAKHTFDGHTSDVMCVAPNPRDPNIFATGSCDTTCKVWDIRTRSAILSMASHQSDVNSVAFMSNGHTFASASDDSSLRLYDVRAARPMQAYMDNKIVRPATSVSFSQTGQLLLAGYDDHTVAIWDTISAAKLSTLPAHKATVSAVAVSPFGTAFATGSWDQSIKIWSYSAKPVKQQR